MYVLDWYCATCPTIMLCFFCEWYWGKYCKLLP